MWAYGSTAGGSAEKVPPEVALTAKRNDSAALGKESVCTDTVQYPTSLAIVSRAQVVPESIEKVYRSCETALNEFLDLGDPAPKFKCLRRLLTKTLRPFVDGERGVNVENASPKDAPRPMPDEGARTVGFPRWACQIGK